MILNPDGLELEHCPDQLIHPAHDWQGSEDIDEDASLLVWLWCEGNDGQDDPLFGRYECCRHCRHAKPRTDGHPDPCAHGKAACPEGTVMLGEVSM